MGRSKSLVTQAREKARDLGESFVVTFFGFASLVVTDVKLVDELRRQPGFRLDHHFRRQGARIKTVRV